jgi:hypothetical protein
VAPHHRSSPPLAVFGLTVLLAATGSAQAQFGPRAGFTSLFGFGPNVSYNPFLPGLPAVPGRFTYTGYTLSGTGANGPYTLNLGFYRNGGLAGGGYYSGIELVPPIATGSSGRVTAQQRSALAQAQRNAAGEKGATNDNPDFDRWLKEAANRREATDPKGARSPAIDAALIDPSPEAVLNGDALNQLAVRIRELEKQGKKATPGLLAPDLTAKVVFAGGKATAAANQFRQPALRFPAALRTNAYTDLRADLEKAYTVVAKEASAGKKVPAAEVDKLLKAVGKANDATRQLVADAPFADAAEVSEFFATLESAAKYLTDAASAGVAGTDWATEGATVAEVVRHQAKFGLKFGPARGDDEAAYYALHRGLLAYYAGLLQAK